MLFQGVASASPADISVMQLNMNEGTDFLEILGAKTAAEFVAAVTLTYNNILATRPAERAAAMAKEIAVRKPLLIGLQEASILRTGNAPPAMNVVFDFPQLLLSELAKLGQEYTAVAIHSGLDAEAPSTLGFDVRLTSQDVILARADLAPDEFRFSNVQVHPYTAQVVVQLPVAPLTLARGWASIDVVVKDRSFRFVTTHLETDSFPSIQTMQASELVQTAGSTLLPVLYAGDFNTPANDPSSPAFPTYEVMLGSGVLDVWSVAHPSKPGFTCCQAQNDRNPVSQLSERSDLIFAGAEFRVERALLVGARPRDRTPSGLWPSDHAGVVAAVCFEGHARVTHEDACESDVFFEREQ